MITRDEYLKGRDLSYPAAFTQQISENADKTIRCVNAGLAYYISNNPSAHPVLCNSGWRPPEINLQTSGAALHSWHMTAQACDLSDPSHVLALWSLRNVARLRACGIQGMERPEATPGWCHWQTEPAASGLFAFWPNITVEQQWLRSGKQLMA